MDQTTPQTSADSAMSHSLLEGIDVPVPSAHHAKSPRAPRPFLPPIVKDNRALRWMRAHRRAAWASLALLLIGAGVGAWRELRFRQPPNYGTAAIDDVLDYTLITDDFNHLPIDQRMDLLRELVRRFGSMEGNESVLMAQWAAMIGGDLRNQMMKNASLLAIDLWDKYAAEYQRVAAENRSEFMDKTVVEFFKLMDSFNPAGPSDVSDEKRLEQAREQASHDQSAIRSGQVSSGELGRMADFMRNGMGKFAAPQTQARASQLMLDMTRHLRGQDIATGLPRKGGPR